MALPPEIGDREVQKFVETDDGKVAVRTQDANINGLSIGNSTTTPLGSNATFTGVWADVMMYPSILVSAATDIQGTLYLEFSDTGSGVSTDFNSFTVYPTITTVERVTVRKRYYRTRFENGIPAQGRLSINTLFGDFPSPVSDKVSIKGPDGEDISVDMHNGVNATAVHDFQVHNIMLDTLAEMKKQTELLKEIVE